MAVPKSFTKNFEISGFLFYHHHAEDSHGTVTDTYIVDGNAVNQKEFYRIIREATEDSIEYVAHANGYYKIRRG